MHLTGPVQHGHPSAFVHPSAARKTVRQARPEAFVLLSFEGPDPYSRAGGLGARVSGLAAALADEGYETHLFFVGSPELPGHEVACKGKLHLHRWCQWISSHHPGGVYDGEEGKLHDWNRSLPEWLMQNLLPALVQMHRPVIVIGEEWQTSWSIISLSRRVQEKDWDRLVRFFWNANNTFGFERVPWQRLDQAATITTVSRFMKHEMWRVGVDPWVIPNGIGTHWLEPWDRKAVNQLKRITGERLLLTKVARWDPEKRWLMAIDAVGELKARGAQPLLVARGGVEAHGDEVVARTHAQRLKAAFVSCRDSDPKRCVGSSIRHDQATSYSSRARCHGRNCSVCTARALRCSPIVESNRSDSSDSKRWLAVA